MLLYLHNDSRYKIHNAYISFGPYDSPGAGILETRNQPDRRGRFPSKNNIKSLVYSRLLNASRKFCGMDYGSSAGRPKLRLPLSSPGLRSYFYFLHLLIQGTRYDDESCRYPPHNRRSYRGGQKQIN